MSKLWDSVKPLIGRVAPMLGTALGGPLGGVAGAALAKALGMESADQETVAKAIQDGKLTPDQLLALRQAEMEFKLRMEELEIRSVQDLESLAVQDRDSARKREMVVRDKIPAILAISVTVGFFGLLFYLMKFAPPSDNADILNILLGALATAWIGVINYYFGTSKSSSDKTTLLHRSTPKD